VDLEGAWRRARDWLSSTDGAALPRHVARQIEQQRQRNEVFTGWVKAGLVTTFALLYTVSPKTAPMDALFFPVPWAPVSAILLGEKSLMRPRTIPQETFPSDVAESDKRSSTLR